MVADDEQAAHGDRRRDDERVTDEQAHSGRGRPPGSRPVGFAEIGDDEVEDAISVLRLARGMGLAVTDADIEYALRPSDLATPDNVARVRAALAD